MCLLLAVSVQSILPFTHKDRLYVIGDGDNQRLLDKTDDVIDNSLRMTGAGDAIRVRILGSVVWQA